MAPKTEGFLVKDTKFWVVRPQISGANVTGLGTLISGAYLGMEIGQSSERRAQLRRAGDGAGGDGRHSRPLLRAEDSRAGFARPGHADLFPPP